MKKLTQEEKEKRNAEAKRWREENPEKYKEVYTKYNKKKWANSTKKEREKISKQCCEWHHEKYNEDPEFKKKCLENGAKWREKNPERIKELNNERQRRKYKEDPEWKADRLRRVQEWRKNNPEKYEEQKFKYTRQRRARKLGVKECFTLADAKFTREFFQHKCAACGAIEKLEIDHWKPLVKGFALSRQNAVLLCKNCNRGKWGHMPEDYFTEEVYNEIQTKLDSITEEEKQCKN